MICNYIIKMYILTESKSKRPKVVCLLFYDCLARVSCVQSGKLNWTLFPLCDGLFVFFFFFFFLITVIIANASGSRFAALSAYLFCGEGGFAFSTKR